MSSCITYSISFSKFSVSTALMYDTEMKEPFIIFQHKILLVIFLLLPSFVFASENILFKSVVIFNTSCARCHEGQCSGRMSFHLPEEAANQHIIRHGGELSQVSIRQLFILLRYMKEECSFYPLPDALVNDWIWASEMLNKFQSPSRQEYFIPIGLLQPGWYQFLFEELNNTKFCAEIINDEFDFVDKDSLYGEHGNKRLKFHIEERLEYFLRLTAQKPINLKRLELENLKSK